MNKKLGELEELESVDREVAVLLKYLTKYLMGKKRSTDKRREKYWNNMTTINQRIRKIDEVGNRCAETVAKLYGISMGLGSRYPKKTPIVLEGNLICKLKR